MAAPKHNLYALGRGGGRPRIFANPEEMEVEIIDYFNYCIENKANVTVTGLVLYIGLSSRNSLYEYKNREEFSGMVLRALTAVEHAYELNLHGFNALGAKFALMNMGWREKTETDITTNGRALGKEIDLTDLTDEELTLLERIKSRQDTSGKV